MFPLLLVNGHCILHRLKHLSPKTKTVVNVYVKLIHYQCVYVTPGTHSRRQKDKCVFLLYVDANSLANSKGQTNVASSGTLAASGGGIAMEFTVKELYAIEEIHSEANLLRLITG